VNKVGSNINAINANWNFAKEVVSNFEEHVSTSVPLYEEGHKLIINLSDYFIKDDSTSYELGSSTGILTHKLSLHNQKIKPNAKFVGIDIEQTMVDFAKEHYNLTNNQFLKDDIIEFEFLQSDMIVAYYTLQFIKPSVRQLLIDKIYQSLNWGGAFIFFEKVRANDARFQDITTGLYQEYKIEQGYKLEEIVAKARSLKGVLEPFSTQGNIDLLKRAGFVDIISIQKYICFEGFLAIK
jgi:tRNA (cmo5U34)-methyltransferase